jgi:hypothetical protein
MNANAGNILSSRKALINEIAVGKWDDPSEIEKLYLMNRHERRKWLAQRRKKKNNPDNIRLSRPPRDSSTER